jgi:hypothetical protein
MSNPSTTTSTKADSFRRVEVITGIGRRRRWSSEEKARIVAESLDPATTSSAAAGPIRSSAPAATTRTPLSTVAGYLAVMKTFI